MLKRAWSETTTRAGCHTNGGAGQRKEEWCRGQRVSVAPLVFAVGWPRRAVRSVSCDSSTRTRSMSHTVSSRTDRRSTEQRSAPSATMPPSNLTTVVTTATAAVLGDDIPSWLHDFWKYVSSNVWVRLRPPARCVSMSRAKSVLLSFPLLSCGGGGAAAASEQHPGRNRRWSTDCRVLTPFLALLRGTSLCSPRSSSRSCSRCC